jgi:PLP dependent protein
VEAGAIAVATNLQRVRERIARATERAGRSIDEITIIAVSKTFPIESIRAAYNAGLRQFAENRVQEWESKQPHLSDLRACWHLIGHLQGNKARRAAHQFDRVDTVDSVHLATKLNSAAGEEGKRLPILIEVRLSSESTKSGVAQTDLAALAETASALPHLELLGLLTIPPYFDEVEQVRPYFQALRKLRDGLSLRLDRPLPVLSMGMSHDFEIAVEEGATEIRIGSDIFGGRSRTD